MKPYKVAICVGRFQAPVHDGHVAMLKKAAAMADTLVVVVGSPEQYDTPYDPFTYEERANVLMEVLRDEVKPTNAYVTNVEDVPDNDRKWIDGLSNAWRSALSEDNITPPNPISDEAVFVCGNAEFAKLVSFRSRLIVKQVKPVSATMVREFVFKREHVPLKLLPEASARFLAQYMTTERYQEMKKEYE